MNRQKLLIQQLDAKISQLPPLKKAAIPPTGWAKAIRAALGMSLRQLGGRIGITKQSARDLELREQEGSITLNSLREVARAMDMDLVYALVPRDGSLDALVDRRSKEVATQIVKRASQSMLLEDQGNSEERIRKAIEERAHQLKQDMPRMLWD